MEIFDHKRKSLAKRFFQFFIADSQVVKGVPVTPGAGLAKSIQIPLTHNKTK